MVEIGQSKFAIEFINGNVRANLTQMAKPFGLSKRPVEWLKTNQAQEYLNALCDFKSNGKSKVNKITLADLVQVKHGGRPGEHGTWAYDRNIVVEFARWLNPVFAIQVNYLVSELIMGSASVSERPATPGGGGGGTPIRLCCIDGVKCYPYARMLEAEGLSLRSGMFWERIRKNPQEFRRDGGEWYVTWWYAGLLHEGSNVRRLHQELGERRKLYLSGGH